MRVYPHGNGSTWSLTLDSSFHSPYIQTIQELYTQLDETKEALVKAQSLQATTSTDLSKSRTECIRLQELAGLSEELAAKVEGMQRELEKSQGQAEGAETRAQRYKHRLDTLLQAHERQRRELKEGQLEWYRKSEQLRWTKEANERLRTQIAKLSQPHGVPREGAPGSGEVGGGDSREEEYLRVSALVQELAEANARLQLAVEEGKRMVAEAQSEALQAQECGVCGGSLGALGNTFSSSAPSSWKSPGISLPSHLLHSGLPPQEEDLASELGRQSARNSMVSERSIEDPEEVYLGAARRRGKRRANGPGARKKWSDMVDEEGNEFKGEDTKGCSRCKGKRIVEPKKWSSMADTVGIFLFIYTRARILEMMMMMRYGKEVNLDS